MNKSILCKCGCIGLSMIACLGQMSYKVRAVGDPGSDAPSGYVTLGEIHFECGLDALTCPSNITKYNGLTGSTTDLFTSYAGDKPIPTKSGYSFVDWKIKSVSNNNDYAGIKMKSGDLMTDWNNIAIGSLFSISRWIDGSSENDNSGHSLELEAVWKKSVGNDQSIPVKVSIPANPINVTLPSSIELVFDGNNVASITANNFSITNNSKVGNIKISQITAIVNQSGWTLSSESADSYFQTQPLDSKELYLGFAKGENSYSALTPSGFDPSIIIGPVGIGNTQNFKVEAKTGGTSTKVDSNLINLEFTFSHEKAYIPPLLTSEEATALGYKFETMEDGNIRLTDMPIDMETVVLPRSIDGKTVTTLHFQYAGGAYQGPATPILNMTMKTLVIPNTITNLDDRKPIDVRTGPFAHAQVLETVIFEESSQLTTLTHGTFEDCPKLKNITLPKTITTLQNGVFERCSSLTDLVIPDSVTSIGWDTFYDCTSLSDLIIPNSVTSIGQDAFYNVPHITYSGSAAGSPWGAKSIN